MITVVAATWLGGLLASKLVACCGRRAQVGARRTTAEGMRARDDDDCCCGLLNEAAALSRCVAAHTQRKSALTEALKPLASAVVTHTTTIFNGSNRGTKQAPRSNRATTPTSTAFQYKATPHTQRCATQGALHLLPACIIFTTSYFNLTLS